MTQIIDKKLKDYRPRPALKTSTAREWISASLGAVALYVAIYCMAWVGCGLGL